MYSWLGICMPGYVIGSRIATFYSPIFCTTFDLLYISPLHMSVVVVVCLILSYIRKLI